MKFNFNDIADAWRMRIKIDQKIQHSLAYMNLSKLVTETDFSECFIQDNRYAVGRLGRRYFCHETDMRHDMAEQYQPLFLPVRLANTQTRDSLALQSPIKYSDLRCYYLGKLLEMTDSLLTLKDEIPRAIMFGEGDLALHTFNKMRALPDYGHHFPNRPPPPGGLRKDEDTPPVFMPAALQPIF